MREYEFDYLRRFKAQSWTCTTCLVDLEPNVVVTMKVPWKAETEKLMPFVTDMAVNNEVPVPS